MVKKELFRSIILTVEHRHGLDPFGEIINDHNSVFMTVDGRRIIGHEVDLSFAKGTECDDKM